MADLRKGVISNDGTAGDPGLAVTHDPGKMTIQANLLCLFVCLAMASPFAYALLAGDYGPDDDPSEDILLFSGFGIGALIFLGWSLHAAMGRRRKLRSYRLEGKEILCSDGRGVLWREPIRAYRQVRWHDERRSSLSKYGRTYYTAQVVTLDHPDPARSFEIFAHQDTNLLQQCCKRWGEATGLPVVRAEVDQAVERSAKELEKPLAALARDGRISPRDEPKTPPPVGVRSGGNGDVIWASARISKWETVVLVSIVLVAGFFTSLETGPRFTEQAPLVLTVSASIAAVIVIVWAGFRQTVAVGASEVIADYRFLTLRLRQKRFAVKTIARIYPSKGHVLGNLEIEGPEGKFHVFLVEPKVATWLAAYLQGAIAEKAAGHG